MSSRDNGIGGQKILMDDDVNSDDGNDADRNDADSDVTDGDEGNMLGC